MKQSDVLDLLKDMPEEIDVDKLLYTLWFRRKIELAVAAADADDDEGIPHEAIEREFETWLD